MSLKEKCQEEKLIKLEASIYASWGVGRMGVPFDQYKVAQELLKALDDIETKYELLQIELDSQT